MLTVEQPNHTTAEYNHTVEHEIARLAAGYFNTPVQVVKKQKLNSNARIHAARVWLQTPQGKELRCIAKYLSEDYFFDPQQQTKAITFANEILSYRFLMNIRNRFAAWPLLYHYNQRILLIEDLGANDPQIPDNLWQEVADVFVNLHTATHQQHAQYQALLSTNDQHNCQHLKTVQQHAFTQARDLLSEYIEVLDHQNYHTFIQLTQQVLHDLNQPGHFHAFIHDDLVDGRQSILRDGKIYLLDFEHGKFGHALMDIATLLIGKMERHLDSNVMIYNHLQAPLTLPEQYRQRWQHNMQLAIDDQHWDQHLASCLIFQAFTTLYSRKMQAEKIFTHSLAQMLGQVLTRLLQCLQGNSAYPQLQAILGNLVGKIVV
ncbi:hypothetical protein MSP8886_02700 [Marinomonas spartinae]|uniref:Phosphotransferase enzyme family protein n=1 Tax=Marinomonas spartinae TaxID=1792290 RepID=A0A1A8TKP0_9GAMM|nr:hypothetical protein [Marinomonas spartinae]SBS33274.1 hypothetical protein MSP8886_02700 [Marinomonas spartinae]